MGKAAWGSRGGTARFIMNPAVVRSPFAEFKEEGVGLMKAKGGLVQMRDCNCGN